MFQLDDQGIGDEFGEAEGDTGTGTSGEGDSATETGGSIDCVASVSSLTITDATDPASVECVTKVAGNLVIGPSVELVDLRVLSALREVGGNLYIVGNLGLTSLEGLEQLNSVGWLHLRRNGALVDLHGPSNLTSVDRISVINNDALTSVVGLPAGLGPSELDIAANDLLGDLDGLPSLTAPKSGNPIDIQIEDHESLTSVAGLADCCANQPVVIELARNGKLADLDGLEPFKRFDTLGLIDNRALADLSGIDATEIGTLELSYDHCISQPGPALVDLSGLEQVLAIDVIRVDWAASLESFAGLDNMSDATDIQVRNNAKLDWQLVVDLVGQSGPTLFEGCGGIGGPECPPDPCPMY